ncbi:MAG: aminoacyl-tRNA hydrolase [bacterium]|nr:aminoacyl-tRNA hydrolase [bacterium]
MYIVVGLGNPGAEYENTRHNAGRAAVSALKNVSAKLITPDSFMNKSGDAVKPLIKNAKQAEKLIVIHDDLDLPFGKLKISFNKSAGGHRGVESIVKAIKTEAFVRIRIGISPITTGGKFKKPKGEEAVERHILGKFKLAELSELKKMYKKINEAVACLISDGREKAMSQFN